ncbi:MAG: 4Fe-4S dicluster domain-containing protein [Candidatus Eisenbacteria bacterium]|nr:4Fe-4S dicluster domain-containing protein [Candidatus Eisenbacteria bacterium]
MAVLQLRAPRREHPLVPARERPPDPDRLRGHEARDGAADGRGRRALGGRRAGRAGGRHLRPQHAPLARRLRAPPQTLGPRVHRGRRRHRHFLQTLKKRRIPERLLDANREALEASLAQVRSGIFDFASPGDHEPPRFGGYGELPVGAQTALRLSQTNLTADYARSGFRLRFEDPEHLCNGCSHCITNCPEGIILWEPDAENGVRVTGAEVSNYCKLCGECISVCPVHLFMEAPYEEVWAELETTP